MFVATFSLATNACLSPAKTGILARETSETTKKPSLTPLFSVTNATVWKIQGQIPQQNSPSKNWRCFFLENRPRCRDPNSVRKKVSFPSTFVGLEKRTGSELGAKRATVFRSWWLKLNQPGRKLYKICARRQLGFFSQRSGWNKN